MNRFASVLPALVSMACSQPSVPGESVRLTIPRGSTVSTVSDSLTARGVIASARWFRLYTKLVGYERSIQAGVYDFPLQAKSSQVLRTLVAGRTAQDRLVVPEGLMLAEIAELAESQLGISEQDFLTAAHDSRLVAGVGAKEPTLEGYLYPNTYHVSVGASALDVVRQMVSEFEARWRPEWDARLDTLQMTRDQAITLASIIEGEAQHPVDLRYVSSVYHNRLARGMRLEADPTVTDINDDAIAAAAQAAFKPAKPMDNTDFGLAWRKEMTRNYVRGALEELRNRHREA
ncbi:MAG: endolytic transglycosylase MltG [Gemmatimonadales bacterium]